MGRKREKPYFSHSQQQHHVYSSLPKRARASKPEASMADKQEEEEETEETQSKPTQKKKSSAMVVVTGLPNGCSVLKLKSRFEMYGCVSRLRIDRGVGYITFRSKEAGEAAIAAALDPSLGIDIDSQQVQVSWANDPVPQWREGVGFSSNKNRPSSRLLRPELPLSRYGRGNKLGTGSSSPRQPLDTPFKGREIIAYDDIL